MKNHLIWEVRLRRGSPWSDQGVPRSIRSAGPAFHDDGLPAEVGLLLPNGAGSRGLVAALESGSPVAGDSGLGLFLADPFLHLATVVARLQAAAVRWVVNLPSVEQQDLEFVQQLSDVGLDTALEVERLARLRAAGFRVMAVVAGPEAARAMVAAGPSALAVLPRVVDYAAGFPSFRQRGAAVRAVAEAARGAGWSGPVLGLAAESELAHETLWPEPLDGVLARPVIG